jgi:membrane protein implicated in regulation of membrane protease activity
VGFVGALVWLIAAFALAGAELFVGEMTLLMLAGGAVAAAGLGLAGLPLWAEIAVFTVVSLGLLVLVKPALKKKMMKPPTYDESPKALVGSYAVVVEDVNAHEGMVRLDGSLWSARAMLESKVFHEGERVQVINIDGTTAVVCKEN